MIQLPRVVPDEYRAALSDAMEMYEIDTWLRIIPFIANIAHECQSFTRLVESLNYSPQRLLAVFPRRFTPAEAVEFAHDEKRIAERLYGGRMGNGPEGEGDGWLYRGRGYIMLTGANNYRNSGKRVGEPLLASPERAAVPGVAAFIAADYWQSRGCNELADDRKYESIRRAINGGLNGFDEVNTIQAKILNEWRT